MVKLLIHRLLIIIIDFQRKGCKITGQKNGKLGHG